MKEKTENETPKNVVNSLNCVRQGFIHQGVTLVKWHFLTSLILQFVIFFSSFHFLMSFTKNWLTIATYFHHFISMDAEKLENCSFDLYPHSLLHAIHSTVQTMEL